MALLELVNEEKTMGLFDFLKSIQKNEVPAIKTNIQVNTNRSIPTIKPEQEIFECYDEVFKTMIADISGLSASEAKEINSIIKNGEGGFLNMGRYQATVWEKYFKGRNWHWNEYEEWNKIFTKLDKFPARFPMKRILFQLRLKRYLVN
ncbi:hypothetical protein [Methylococcus sp. EFPC2]|uniref:hypothetical protein n=1 Tax=Methylococcus sp. EFPC2 TaxID=2812648 RepID=UPI0019675851|nr:hypothetical protein [Methylococcus sp. EFPC2]QSA96553.1 hypothetical protein JWZ97_15215 [Methylococcus sp. EFPC2]